MGPCKVLYGDLTDRWDQAVYWMEIRPADRLCQATYFVEIGLPGGARVCTGWRFDRLTGGVRQRTLWILDCPVALGNVRDGYWTEQ